MVFISKARGIERAANAVRSSPGMSSLDAFAVEYAL